jgi:hypothetical protein
MAGKVKTLLFSDGVTTTAPDISAGGSGEINMVTSPNDIGTDWLASGSGITRSATNNTAELPLAGAIDTAILITAVSGSDYVYYRWTMPEALKNKKLKLEWFQRVSGTYASGGFKVEVYKNSAANYSGSYTEFALSTDSSGTSSIPAANGKYTTTFDTDSGDYYELRIVRVSGTTWIAVSNVVVGPGIQPQGAVVGEWQSFTPTFTAWGTVTSPAVYWRRSGSSLFLDVTFTAGTLTGATNLLSLPSGLTVDTARIGALAVPVGVLGSSGNTTTLFGLVKSTDTSNIGFSVQTNAFQALTPATFNSTSISGVLGPIPIAEWAGSGTLNVAQNDVEYAYNTSTTDAADTTSFGYGPGGGQFGNFTATRSKRVQWQRPQQVGDYFSLEYSSDGGVTWNPPSAGGIFQDKDIQNSVHYGVSLSPVSATQMDVSFGAYRNASGATFGAAGENWSAVDADPTYRWRVRKVSGGAAVGFGLASATSSGLVNPYTEGSGVVYAGTYTPTKSGESNCSVTMSSCMFMRVGKMVTVAGRFDVDVTTVATATEFFITLPIASNLTTTTQLAGSGAHGQAATPYAAVRMIADAGGDKCQFSWYAGLDSVAREMSFTFMYEIV